MKNWNKNFFSTFSLYWIATSFLLITIHTESEEKYNNIHDWEHEANNKCTHNRKIDSHTSKTTTTIPVAFICVWADFLCVAMCLCAVRCRCLGERVIVCEYLWELCMDGTRNKYVNIWYSSWSWWHVHVVRIARVNHFDILIHAEYWTFWLDINTFQLKFICIFDDEWYS